MMYRFLISGGGTGGHIYPALAIARGLALRFPGAQLLYVGTSTGLEADIVPREGIPFATITVEGFSRSLSPRVIRAGAKLVKGMAEAVNLVRNFHPDLVVGTGGFVSGPVVFAATLQGIPTLVHEQNAFPGLTNRLLARLVSAVCLTFQEAAAYLPAGAKVYHTGLPVRAEVLSTSRADGAGRLGVEPTKLTVLATGGSRGAASLNRAMTGVLREATGNPDLQVLLATGTAHYQEYLQSLDSVGIDVVKYGNITIKPYFYNMADALAASDLVIGRAGASFLAEVMVRGLPAILIPYPHATGNHQEHNAMALAKKGAAILIKDRDLTPQRLVRVVRELLGEPVRLRLMAEQSRLMGRPDALQGILMAAGDLLAG